MHYRLYAKRTNTIFKRNSGSQQQRDGLINTGKNTISELYTGNSESKFLLSFDLSPIKDLLESFNFTCKLKVWDAGVIYEPTIQLNNVNLYYFQEEFVEGDGFAYFDGKALIGLSNFQNRDSLNTWVGVFNTGQLPAFNLSNASQDLEFTNLEGFVNSSVTADALCNFAIEVQNLEPLATTSYTKFVHTRHTRTIFQPFLEFEIDDTILDNRNNMMATKVNRLHLNNETGDNFTGILTCKIVDEFGVEVANPTVINPSASIYYIEYTPDISLSNKLLNDEWFIDGVSFTRNAFKVVSPNQILTPSSTGLNGLSFYPNTSYLKPIIKHGDKVQFNVISQIRSKGNVIIDGYEYKVVTSSNFEIIPWQRVNQYNNKLFFYVDTSYFYPELDYEVFVRLNDGKQVKTSGNTYKFRLISEGPTHLDGRAASPYNNRDWIFNK